MGAVASLSRGATLCALDIAQLGVFIFGFFFLVGWIAEETTKERWKRYRMLFVIMAIGGVAGEWIADIAVFALSEHLQTISDKEVAKLKLDTQHLATEQAEASERVANAQRDAAEANARAAEANQKAEEDRVARLKIEQRFADRTLTNEQIAAIAAKLRPFVPQAYEITPYWDMKESMSITNRIYQALVLAGWTQNEPQKGRAMLGGVVGVLVYIHPAAGSKTKDAANSLVSALNADDISSELKQENPTNNPPNDVLGINVGAKF
jgi:hypothetical protein